MDNLNGSPVVSNQQSSRQYSSLPSNYHYHQQRNGHQHHNSRQHQINLPGTKYSHSPPQSRIAVLQEEYLIPMKEDLSDWLKVILDIDDLDANNFMSRLDNGVIVCKLAKLIEEKCDIDNSKQREVPPTSNGITNNHHPKMTNNNNNNTSITQNHVYLNGQNNHTNGNHLNKININNVLNDIQNNNNNNNNNNKINSDHKANTSVNNNSDIIYEDSINNSRSPSSNGDHGQYRSKTFFHNGRRLSFNGHSPVNGSSSPYSNYSTNSSSSINKICARTMKCWENAKSETFYARDNVSNFIKWCRKLNVRECNLFESEDLVLHHNPKNVVLCLLEVAQIACKKFSFTPAPGLVLFEQEIDAEEKAELEREIIRRRKKQQQQSVQLMASTTSKPTSSSSSSSTYNKTSTTINNNINNIMTCDKPDVNNSTNDNVTRNNNLNSSSEDNNNVNGDNGDILICGYNGDDGDDEDEDYEDGISSSSSRSSNDDKCPERADSMDTASKDGQSSIESEPINNVNDCVDGVDNWSSGNQENLGRASSVTSISSTSAESTETQSSQEPFGQESKKVVSQLDQKVMLIAKSYYGKKAKHGIQRLAEGKYRIAGKIVFVRLLKDRHVMVRVGGGWDTLQHFLERHGNGSDSVKEISPADLLPMDTRPSESMSRRRNSQSSQQSVPSTPILRRCLSSNPISRRSSLSSPEPWTSASSVTGSTVKTKKVQKSWQR